MANVNKANVNGTLYNITDAGAVRFDGSQSLTSSQQSTARGNIGAGSASDVRDLKSAIDYGTPFHLIWEQGRLTLQGEETDSNYLCRTKAFSVNAGETIIIVQPPLRAVMLYYYNGTTFVERIVSGAGTQAKLGTRYFTIPANVNNVRLVLGLDGVTPITPKDCESIVYAASMNRAYMGLINGNENGVHRNAKLHSFGNSILTGTVYTTGTIDHVVAYDNAPYAGVAVGLGVEQKNVEHTLLSSTGLLYDAGQGSFLSNIKQTSLVNYDYLTTHLWTDDMSNFPLGSIEDSVADDGTIVGGVLSLLNYIRSNNALCNLVLVSVPPVGISSAGSGVFDAVYANGHSIKELDDVMHKLADIYHFIYIDWQDMYLSYHYQEYTYQANNVHLASDAPYRTMAEYLSRKVKMNDYKSPIWWVNGICVGAEWEQGRVSTTGDLIDTTTSIRTKKIPLENKSALYINAPLSYMGALYYYNGQTFVSYENIHNLPMYSSVPSNADSVIVTIRKGDLSDILPKSGEDVSILDKDGTIMDAVISKGEPQYRTPLLTIIDDDSNERFYNDLYQVMKNKNVSIATAVITGSVGNPGQMSWDEIQECSANGMEILSHTNRHFLSTDPDFDTLTIRDITIDYQKAKNILALHGVPTNILVFSGSTGLTAKFQTAAKRVYKAGILAGDNTTNFQGGDPYGIRRYRVGNQTNYHCDIDVLKGLVDSVKNTGGWMIWMTHTSGGANAWTPGTGEGSSAYILGQAVDYAISNHVPVVTAEYGFTQYFSNFQNMDVQPYQ